VYQSQGTFDKPSYMSVEGCFAFYETKVLSLKCSWNRDIDTRPIHMLASRITQKEEKACVRCIQLVK
jgi:hypothetical protein